jgi:tetratricopeptide (TPR) repeat protein
MRHGIGSVRAAVLRVAAALLVVAAGCDKPLDPRLQEGYDLVLQGKVDEAISMANVLLGEDPNNAPARNLIGLALYKAGDTEGSIEQYRMALEIDGGYTEAHFNLGNSYQMLGRLQEAEDAFREAVRHESKAVLAHYNLGILYRDTDRPGQALAEFRACVENEPQFYYAYLAMGQMQYAAGEFEDAVANLGRALELVPDQKELRVLHGNALLRSSAPDAERRAVEDFRAAVSIDSTYVDAHYNLGVALATQGDMTTAQRHFDTVLRLTRDNPARSDMVKRVQEFLEDRDAPADAGEGSAG